MSHATGLGLADTALLLAVDAAGAGERYKKSSLILKRLAADTGEEPMDAYMAMTSLIQPWLAPLPLLDGNGNFGSPGYDSPADPGYTECRLSPAGRAAVAAERGDGPPVPFGLVNGSTFRGGLRPPFSPAGVAWGILAVAGGEAPEDAALTLGVPAFPGGATTSTTVDGRTMDDLRRGWGVQFTFRAVLRHGEGPALEIVALPPYANPDEIAQGLATVATAAGDRSPLAELVDGTSQRAGLRLLCIPPRWASLEELETFVRNAPGVDAQISAQLSAPLADLLAGWVRRHGKKAASAGAEVLRELAATP